MKLSDYTPAQQARVKRLARKLVHDCVFSQGTGLSGADGERLSALGPCVQVSHVREEGTVIDRMKETEAKPYTLQMFISDCQSAGVLP